MNVNECPIDNECQQPVLFIKVLVSAFRAVVKAQVDITRIYCLLVKNVLEYSVVLIWTISLICSLPFSERIDLHRVPAIIHEAKCLTSHSCTGVEGYSSLETIPISIKMPVLKKNRKCPFFSLEFETVSIACLCATSRQS